MNNAVMNARSIAVRIRFIDPSPKVGNVSRESFVPFAREVPIWW
jgi:hypothetical protein